MLWLPHLESADGKWRLPLANASAPALLVALTEGASERAAAVVARALEDDAAFALWTLVLAASRGEDELRTVAALADWLAREAGSVLVWAEGGAQISEDAAWIAEYERLQHLSRAVARRARTRLPPAIDGERAYLLGLLHQADRWWNLAAGLERPANPSSSAAAPGARRPSVPTWLADSLESSQLDELARTSSAHVNEPVDGVAAPAREATDALVASLLPQINERFAQLIGDAERFQPRLETEKLAALAEFAAGAGHEINNPIAVISGRAQLLLEDERDPERRRELAVINTQAMRVYEMISDLMLFARPPKSQLADCDLVELVDRVVGEISPRAAERHVIIERRGLAERRGHTGSALVRADATQIVVAMRALCDNALAAMVGGGRLTITIDQAADIDHSVKPESIRPGYAVTVSDTGPGISSDVRQHLFDPFYSGRPAGRGLGLGLAKCWRIIASHAGGIEVASDLGRGASFTVYLPAMSSV